MPCVQPCKANGSSQLALGDMGITSTPPYKIADSTQLAARFILIRTWHCMVKPSLLTLLVEHNTTKANGHDRPPQHTTVRFKFLE